MKQQPLVGQKLQLLTNMMQPPIVEERVKTVVCMEPIQSQKRVSTCYKKRIKEGSKKLVLHHQMGCKWNTCEPKTQANEKTAAVARRNHRNSPNLQGPLLAFANKTGLLALQIKLRSNFDAGCLPRKRQHRAAKTNGSVPLVPNTTVAAFYLDWGVSSSKLGANIGSGCMLAHGAGMSSLPGLQR